MQTMIFCLLIPVKHVATSVSQYSLIMSFGIIDFNKPLIFEFYYYNNYPNNHAQLFD